MGKYINHTPDGREIGSSFTEKKAAMEYMKAIPIEKPMRWQEGLCCVVDNGDFAAIAYAYNEREMMEFLHPDPRPKQWYVLEEAKKIAK